MPGALVLAQGWDSAVASGLGFFVAAEARAKSKAADKSVRPTRTKGGWPTPDDLCAHHSHRGCPILAFFARVGFHGRVRLGIFVAADARAKVKGGGQECPPYTCKGVRVRVRRRSCLRQWWVAADVRSLFAPWARFGMTRRFGGGGRKSPWPRTSTNRRTYSRCFQYPGLRLV